tara:strand:+ start:55 stop:1479 length:1425 start_codon:yes stop_codon:yes gene_type:complete
MKSNLLLIVVDSLRQDKCLGSKKTSSTPNLDSFIKNGIFFEQAISPSPITIPSLSSIFTGLYPFESTNLEKDIFTLNNHIPTFIETFEKNGYSTHAIIPEALNYTNISKKFLDVEFFNSFATLYDGVGDKIIKKLKDLENKKPWFLYIHLEDLHGYAQFNLSSDVNNIDTFIGENKYERMLSAIDPWIGKFLKNIDEENTLIILTSDHGSTSADFTDEMYEFSLKNEKIKEPNDGISFKVGHKMLTSLPKTFQPIRKKIANMYINKKNKSIENKLQSKLPDIQKLNPTKYQERLLQKSLVYPNSCYDENFRPVLVFSGYGIKKNKIIKTQISTIDIFPTIFDIFQIKISKKTRGQSLVPLFNDQIFEEKLIMLDGASNTSRSKYSDTIGIRTSQYKYFRDRKDPRKDIHLYNLLNDPLELNNIHEKHPNLITSFEKKLKEIESTKNFLYKNVDKLTDSDTEKAKTILRDLGYMK